MKPLGLGYRFTRQGSLLNYLRWFSAYKTRVEADSGNVQDDDFSKSVYKILSDYRLKSDMKLSIIAEGGLKARTSGVEKYVTKAYDLSDEDNDSTQTTESEQPFLGGRIAPNEIQNFKSVTNASKTLDHTGITVSGTYTIIKVLNDENDSVNPENSGKTVVSFTEVGSGTYNSISWNGRLYVYMIYGGTISGANQALIGTDLLSLVEEVESVVIGTQEWATSNCEMVATPEGNVIAEMQTASATDKVTNGTFDADSDWTKGTGWSIAVGVASCDGTQVAASDLGQAGILTSSKWYKATFDISNYVAGNIKPVCGTADYQNESANGSYTHYIKANGTGFAMQADADFEGDIDNVTCEELGWADSADHYDDLVNNQGYTVQEALEECAWWCYYNNDSEIGSVYGKLYNWYAAKLLQNDIDTYNASNPDWGWHVPTQAEFETLKTYLGGENIAAGKMKVVGTNYWNEESDGADNNSGFSWVGSGCRRNDNGAPESLKSRGFFWTQTSLSASDARKYETQQDTDRLSTAAYKTNNKKHGFSLRLLRDL